MNAPPLVSIVTPTLNQGRFIEQTIRSIKGQSYPNLEHIVVDGGSTDDTLDILRRYEGTYNLRWLSEPDRGMYDAINKGMRLAGGEILAYLNSDDLYFPWTLEVVVDHFSRHPGADMVCGDAVRVDLTSGQNYLLFQPRPFADLVRRSGFLAQPTVFWRRSLWVELGEFDADLRYVADCDFWMRAVDGHRLDKIDEFLAVDTIHRGALRGEAMAPLMRELARVRAEYVTTRGTSHWVRVARNRAWGAAWRRLSWMRLLVAAHLPPRARRGPWAHWLREASARISLRNALLAQLPLLGERFAYRAVQGADQAPKPQDAITSRG